jgi:hypothetical protein
VKKVIKSAAPEENSENIECNEDILNRLRDEPYISNNFKLNIKKLDDSWYSVYFDAKQHS